MLTLALTLIGAAAAPAAASCKVLVVAKAANEPVYSDDTVAASCPAVQPASLLRYDGRRKLVLARGDLLPGAELGIAYLPLRPAVAAGDEVTLTASIGRAVVSRSAKALQTARPGQRFFVRTADGTIFVAPALRRAEITAGHRP